MARVWISPEAEQDLLDIWLFIAADSPRMLIGSWTGWRASLIG